MRCQLVSAVTSALEPKLRGTLITVGRHGACHLAAQGEEGGRQLRRPSRLWPVYRRQRNKELCKGRLAMFVTSGLVAADLFTSKEACNSLARMAPNRLSLALFASVALALPVNGRLARATRLAATVDSGADHSWPID